MKRLLSLVALAVFAAPVPSGFAWETAALHAGLNDPTAEGWTVSAAGGTMATSGLTDGGTPVWQISDSGGGYLFYRQSSLSSDQRAKAVANGWRVTARLRVPGATDGVDQGALLIALAALPDNTYRSFLVDFGSDAATNLLVYAYGSSGVHTSTPGYHTAVLEYSAARLEASLWLDGVMIVPNLSGDATGPGAWLSFGTFDFSVGTTRWNEVRFDIDDTPVVTNVTETGAGYGLNWLGSTSHLSSLQVSGSAGSNAAWTTLGTCSGLVWRSNLCCTNQELQTQRFFRILQYQP